MENLRIWPKKVTVFLLLAVLAGSLIGIGKTPVVVNAASKTVTVKTVKKGTKITSGNYVYKVTLVSKKKSTVSVVGLTADAKKRLTKAVVPKSVKIKSKNGKNKGTYSYKVTAVAKNAFKGNKKITKVTIGDYVTSIEKNAFSGCTKLKTVTPGKSVKTIGGSAFAGDKELAMVVIPKDSKLETIGKKAFKGCIKLKKINLGNAKNLKKIDDSAFEDTAVDQNELERIKEKIKEKAELEKIAKYSYEVIPLMAPFNSYFYIKTDNPDPDSFRFVDEDTKYADTGGPGSITPTDTVFSDVKYEDGKTLRVKGGYIATGSATDGGKLKLQLGKVAGTYPVYNMTTGETTIEKDYEYKDTTVTVQVAGLKDVVDYLISTYGDSSKPYFDNLSGIESGFSSECLYSGAYVLGKLKKGTTAPYYGLSTSPHVDQDFYIQSPYYRVGSKPLLASALYPMEYDSIGFPSIMMSVAKELDSTVDVKWSSWAHYLIDVTYNGETQSFGGAGSGGGQGINANQIKYWYSFDGSNGDAYMKRNLKDVSAMIQEYGAMEVPEEPTDQPKLTWASVRQAVGKEGSYVKLTLITSIFGGSTDGYTFLYDDGSTGEGSEGWGAIGYFSNAWYDGRYFNKWEYYYPGARFEDTVKTETPSIIMKDVSIKLPDDGKTYYYNYSTMNEVSQYNAETGVWSGFMTYYYDSASQTWKADILDDITYREDYYSQYNSIEDQDFIDACTITMDEALAMNLDANTDKEPENYYIYDRVTSPGTYHRAGDPQNPPAQTSLANAVITFSASAYSYDGKAKEPEVTVTLGSRVLESETDYAVTYANNKNIGTATVTITGQGDYTGTAKKTFKIEAKKGSKFTVGFNNYKITSNSTVSFTGWKSKKEVTTTTFQSSQSSVSVTEIKSANTTKVTVPKTVKIGGKNFKVTSVAENALKGKKVTSVTVGSNVTTIGKNAFANCKTLGTVTIKSTKLKTVGKNAFKGIKATAKIKVPAKKLSAYKKLLKGKGQGKKVKIKAAA